MRAVQNGNGSRGAPGSSSPPGRSRTSPCPRCGALNGEGFDRCVRCAAPLTAAGVTTEKLGSKVDASQLYGTKAILALTTVVFAGQVFTSTAKSPWSAVMTGGLPRDLLRFGAMPMSYEDVRAEPFRLLSAVFVHFGALHFAMNMLSLANVGRAVEPGIGSARFVVAYLTAGVVGFAANIAVDLLSPFRGVTAGLTAGASGAVFGVMGLIIGWLYRMRDKRWRSFAIQAAFFALIVNLLGNINNGAHVGGLVCGAAFGFFYAARPRPRSLLVPNVVASVGFVLAIVSLVLAQRAAGWGKAKVPPGALLDPSDAPAACASVLRRNAPLPPVTTALPSREGAPCRRGDSVREVAV